MMLTPTVLMDSHLFDYNILSKSERRKRIDFYIEELTDTGGEALSGATGFSSGL